jgi:O-antigen/teichoic acid export membrane protein
MTRIKRLITEGSWILTGQVIAVAGALALIRVLTDLLDPAQYGQLALALTLAGLINQVLMGGVTAGIGRFYSISIEKGDLWGYVRTAQRLMGYATVGIFVIALILTTGFYVAGQQEWLGLMAAVMVFSILSGYNSAFNSVQNAARQRAIVALHGGIDAWLKIGLAFGFALWIGASSTAAVLGFSISILLITLSQIFFLRRLLQRHEANANSPSTEDWAKQMWMFSWPMMAGGLFSWGYYASQRWALELFVSTAEVGKFYALTQIAYSPISLGGSLFMSFLVPILYQRAADPGSHERIANVRNIVFKIAAVGVAATLLVSCITVFLHNEIFRLLAAEQYRDLSAYMPLVVIAAGLLQASTALGSILAAVNKTREVIPLAVYGQTIIIVSNITSTYLYGINGLIYSMVFGAALHIIWMYRIIVKHGNARS